MQPISPSPWQRFKSWFKTFQKRNNDIILTPLAIALFIKLPLWWNEISGGEVFHPFAADALNALPLALVFFSLAHLGAYTMFRLQEPDLFDEYTQCNEKDLLKKVVSNDEALLKVPQSNFITHLQYRQAWRIHFASQRILSRYFWALVVLQAVITATVPTQR